MIQYPKNILQVPEFKGTHTITLPAYGLTTSRTYLSSLTIPDNRYARIIRISNGLSIADSTNFSTNAREPFSRVPQPTFEPLLWIRNRQQVNCKVQIRRSGTTSRISYRFEISGPVLLWESTEITRRNIPAGTRTTGGGEIIIWYEQYKLPVDN